MDIRLNLGNLDTPQDIQKLTSIIAEMADGLDVLYTETAPNGNISARQGRIAIYKNGSTYETWQNTTGSNIWQQIDAGISIPLTYIDTDSALAANSDTKVASQKAVKTYVDTKVPVPLTAAKGGTGSAAEANAASGVVVLNASLQLPAVSGALLTNLPAQTTQTNEMDASSVAITETNVTLATIAKTITSGKTVLIIATGNFRKSDTTGTPVFHLKHDTTVVQIQTFDAVVNWTLAYSMCAIVTGLSGSVTFSVLAVSGCNNGNAFNNNLVVLEF